jgi:RNA polymerase sigma factor (sigma-70 family)
VWIASLQYSPLSTRRGGVLDARELLVDNLDVVERAIRFAARRYRLDPSNAEELDGVVKLRLVENDYAILRAHEGRSSFRTYIGVVVQRMALDYCIHLWGKWHSSAEARRLGALAVDLEKLLHRDGRTLEEAVTILRARNEGVTLEALKALQARLPPRTPRPGPVFMDDDEFNEMPAHSEDTDEQAFADERRRASQKISTVVSAFMAALPAQDRTILQLRYEGRVSVAQIARSFALDQKRMYERIDRLLLAMRRELEGAGLTWRGDVADLIGRDEEFVHFDFGSENARPSKPDDERPGPETEEP